MLLFSFMDFIDQFRVCMSIADYIRIKIKRQGTFQQMLTADSIIFMFFKNEGAVLIANDKNVFLC